MANDSKPIGEVVKVHGWLDDEHTKAFASISWNGRPPRNEIRIIRTTSGGETRFGSGVPLSDKEAEKLLGLLEANRGVDLDEVFATSTDIMKNRNAGFTTADGGKIVLRRKT